MVHTAATDAWTSCLRRSEFKRIFAELSRSTAVEEVYGSEFWPLWVKRLCPGQNDCHVMQEEPRQRLTHTRFCHQQQYDALYKTFLHLTVTVHWQTSFKYLSLHELTLSWFDLHLIELCQLRKRHLLISGYGLLVPNSGICTLSHHEVELWWRLILHHLGTDKLLN